MQPSPPTVPLLALAVRLPWQWAARLASLAWRAACLGVLMISPASYLAPYGGAIASRLVVDTLPLLAGYAAFSALLSVVITRIVVTTAVTYGLTQYAMEVVIRMLVLDEAVSALDVSVQAQVLNLLRDLQDEFGLAYVFISHDLAVVRFISDEVLVMKDGQVVEQASAAQILAAPQQDYTRRLLGAVPRGWQAPPG